MGASAEGLQVLRRDGAWIPITALPDQIIVNVGDMLARLTNDTLKSTVHRVVNPPRELLGHSPVLYTLLYAPPSRYGFNLSGFLYKRRSA